MDTAQERRVRRMLSRQGLNLVKSRRRNRTVPDHGCYWILDRPCNRYVAGETHGMSLDEVETWVKQEAAALVAENGMRRTNLDKTRGKRIRRMLAQLGFCLVKSSTRDSTAPEYGRYWFLSVPDGSCLIGDIDRGMTLDEAEALILAEYNTMKEKVTRPD